MIVSNPPAGDAQVARLQQVVLRRRFTIGLVLAIVLGLSLMSYLATPPRYSAEAVLALDVRQLQGMPSEAVISPLPQDSPALKTELDIIQSRLLAEKVLDRLTAAGVTLDPYRRQLGLAERAKALVQPLLAAVWPAPSAATAIAAATPAQRRDDTIGLLLSNLRVANDGHSLTIFVSYTADDPETAAAVANAFAQAYLDHRVEVQLNAVEMVRDWLGEKVASLRHDVETAESARTRFRQENGIVEVDGTTLQARRVTTLDQELVGVRASLGGAQARLDTARQLAAGKNGLAFTEILASPTIQSFRIEQARLQREIEDIDNAGATKSGELPALKSQLATIDQQIAAETRNVIDSLANEVAVLTTKEARLTAELTAAQADLARSNMAEVKAAELDREAGASRELYDSYLTRYKQTVEQDGIASPQAQLISQAQPARGRISPSLSFAVMAGLAGGALAGIGAAFLRELTDHRIHSPRQVEDALGTEIFASIASPPRSRRARRRQAVTAFDRSIANLHAKLRSHITTSTAHIVAVTSARQREGKTLVTTALARSLAASGCLVLVFDLDLDAAGTEDALVGEPAIGLDKALRKPDLVTPVGRPDEGEIVVVSCRPGRLPPEVLVDAKRFGALLAKVRDRFDMILIDTPAMSTGAVAMQASARADLTLLVVNTSRASVRDLTDVATQLRNSGHGELAIVTTDFSRPAPFPIHPEIIGPIATTATIVGQAGPAGAVAA
jgi:uncharacterized protein involved in exopolysaccharide biosynthesis/Mrp family chromosome partitioning ATPase